MPASSMKKLSTASMATESKAPTLASRVENPPRPIAENAWQVASNQLMPASRSETRQTIVMPTYTR